MIGIDGRGGAGKSVLARRLQQLVPNSAVVHTDDVAWNQAFFDWGALLAADILQPLRAGRAVNFRPPAWRRHGRPGSIGVPAGCDVVWVEGTGVVRAELADLLDAAIYLQGDLREQTRRLTARDGQDAETRGLIAEWLAEEIPFLASEQPWVHADVVIDTTEHHAACDRRGGDGRPRHCVGGWVRVGVLRPKCPRMSEVT